MEAVRASFRAFPMWISASDFPMLRDPEWSISQTCPSLSRHSSMKWFPPPPMRTSSICSAATRAKPTRSLPFGTPRTRGSGEIPRDEIAYSLYLQANQPAQVDT